MVMWGDKSERKQDNIRLINSVCLILGLIALLIVFYDIGLLLFSN